MRGRGPRRDLNKERFWRRTLRRQETSGLSVREFCARQSVAEPAFYAWRREIQRRDRHAGQSTALAGAGHPRRPAAGPVKKRCPRRPAARPTFLPVSVANVAAPVPVEIALPSGVVLRIGPACDGAMLRAVLGALKESAC